MKHLETGTGYRTTDLYSGLGVRIQQYQEVDGNANDNTILRIQRIDYDRVFMEDVA